METKEAKPGLFVRLCRELAHPVITFIFGVGLPATSVAFGMYSGIDAELFDGDLTGNMLQRIAMCLVPALNFIVWLCCIRGRGVGSVLLRAMCGFSFGIAVVYAVAFLPLAVFGTIFCCFTFWYFGIGFLGLLPTGPFFAALAAMGLKRGLDKKNESDGRPKAKGFVRGLAAAGVVWIAVFAELGVEAYSMRMAVSDEPALSAKGVSMLRTIHAWTDDAMLWKKLRGSGRAEWFAPWSVVKLLKPGISMEKRRIIYYRVAGEDPETVFDIWGSRERRRLSWDRFVGGEKMGGVLDGLSLKGSSYSTVIDEPGNVGYAEWTLVFSNDGDRQQEARARIALPPGGVVSRLTLWINGEERESAFGTKGQVRRAYESVVNRRRDPVLVNVCGPDQVQMQCFPVPSKGEMKVRIGITVPLELADDGKTARLPAPAILTQNFSIPGDLLGLPTDETKALEKPPAATAVYVEDKYIPIVGRAVVQRMARAVGWKPRRVAVVLDSSRSMETFFKTDALSALSAIPNDLPVDLWIVGDEPPKAPTVSFPANDKGRLEAIKDAIDVKDCAGGRCNLVTLVRALDSLAKSPEPAALVWIHAAQPVVSQTADVLSAKIAGAANVRTFLCQVAPGTCEISSSLASVPSVHSCTASALKGGAVQALENVFSKWGSVAWQATRANVARADVPEDAVKAGRHIGRLWAAEETVRTYRVGDPVSLEKAQKLALPWQIVTPVTGAVVLETAEQYKQNNLKPAAADSVPTTSSSVPTVPEPGSTLCLVLAALVLGFVLACRARRACV